jgi:hypothetical protein
MFDLAFLWLIVWLLKNAAMDVMYASSGKPNPRYEAKKAKARAGGQSDPAQHRYGSRDWFADLLSDGLQAQTDRRRRKADEKRKARGPVDGDQAGGAGAQAVDPAQVNQPRRVPRPQPGQPGSGQPASGQPAPGSGQPAPGQPAPGSGRPGPVAVSDADVVDMKPRRACSRPDCPRGVIQETRQWPGRPNSSPHADQWCTVCGWLSEHGGPPPADVARPGTPTSGPGAGGAPDPEQQQPPRPTPAPDNRPDAKVIPFRTTNQQEEPVSTDVNSEIVGLDQSIAYARSLAAFAGEHETAGNEGYIGHLTQRKVVGQALQSAYDMQAAFEGARVAAEAHANELERQRGVQEQYDANPDAGDKSYQTEGR